MLQVFLQNNYQIAFLDATETVTATLTVIKLAPVPRLTVRPSAHAEPSVQVAAPVLTQRRSATNVIMTSARTLPMLFLIKLMPRPIHAKTLTDMCAAHGRIRQRFHLTLVLIHNLPSFARSSAQL